MMYGCRITPKVLYIDVFLRYPVLSTVGTRTFNFALKIGLLKCVGIKQGEWSYKSTPSTVSGTWNMKETKKRTSFHQKIFPGHKTSLFLVPLQYTSPSIVSNTIQYIIILSFHWTLSSKIPDRKRNNARIFNFFVRI